jgi:cellobiose phosphorylase
LPVDLPTLAERISRLRAWPKGANGNGHGARPPEEQPLRAELYSVDQLERHAKALAGWHRASSGRAPDKLIPRLDANERVLIAAYDAVTTAVDRGRRIAPAAEWLLDNFYLIEEQIRTARRHLPRSYSRELPRLGNGPSAGYPRVYGIAIELISHVDGGIDVASLDRFIAAYQTIQPLALGELWAVPIMLRLALIENLRRVAARIAAGRRDRDLAEDWAERMVTAVERNPADLVLVIADMARADPPLSSAFLTELTRHLQGSQFAIAHTWLDQRLSEQGFTLEQLLQADGRAQAADQVSIGNSINSLRFLSSADWPKFVESHSVVEQQLRGDPAGVYSNMSFATRDRYRHAVEEIARRGRLTEQQVARKAVHLAQTEAAARPTDRSAHVGYYLIDAGRGALERIAQMRLSPAIILEKIARRYPLPIYLTAVTTLTLATTVAFMIVAARWGAGAVSLVLVAVPALLCAAHLGIGIVNLLATVVVRPRLLPRLDFGEGIPAPHRTAVIVPTFITSPQGIDDLLENLEVRYLANRDKNLHFVLLTDFRDAPQEVMSGDDELLTLAREGVEELNQRYVSDRPDIFLLLHRPRRWNETERVWMGHERKRGKVVDFNTFLRGGDTAGASDRFSLIVGDTTHLHEVKYVITLDADTYLPRESARKLAAAMAHPLNRPVWDAQRCRVVDGYSILQPRVGINLPSAQRSWFAWLFAGEPGVDPYTRMVSDVYQDLFGEGSFIGKGIYDVDSFALACNRFPENAILSHDLLESAYARSGLVSDIELFEDQPSHFATDSARRHRWIRGDWQIAWWLLSRVPGPENELISNPISALSWWKIFDNLRRSLLPAAMVLLLVGTWLLAGPGTALAATLLVLFVLVGAPVLSVLGELMVKTRDLPFYLHLRSTAGTAAKQGAQVLLTLVFLPNDALVNLDAIVRTLVRVLATRTKLLEWQTFNDAQREARTDLAAFIASMAFAPLLATASMLCLWVGHKAIGPIAAPLLALWLASPLLAWWMSRPLETLPVGLSPKQTVFLETLARRTWRFFEVFVNATENWLPPDNYEEHPAAQVTSRTSPTNIGLSLLSNLAAFDLGYIAAAELIDRTQKTIETIGRLPKHRGHLFNWVDTRSLQPLPPLYVSTVDSGNLVGALLILRRGLIELIDASILPPRTFGGLRDTCRLLAETARSASAAADLVSRIDLIERELENAPFTLSASALLLQRLVVSAAEIAAAVPDGELRWWAGALERGCAGHRDDLLHMAPWATLPAPPQAVWHHGAAVPAQRLADTRELLARLEDAATLRQIGALQESVLPSIDAILADFSPSSATANPAQSPPQSPPPPPPPPDLAAAADWLAQLRRCIVDASARAVDRIKTLGQLARQCEEFADVDFSFLLDESRDIFATGYNVSAHRLDASFYDLLASEARLTSYVAIAQGKVDQDHWFALGRMLTTSGGAPALLSWSGSMFEYLMPVLVMPTYANTLLASTYKAVVRRQISYGKSRGVPWGISESGYNATDTSLNYQYRAFGVPGLGLKRGLAEDLVIAPYASALALMVAPEAACKNLQAIAADGHMGIYGMYEAIDYTPSRRPPGAKSATVREFMAHHHGMTLLSLDYFLRDRPMQKRFESDLILRAADLLLHERVPKSSAPVFPHASEAGTSRGPVAQSEAEGTMRVFTDPSGLLPEVHLLSNGRYHVVVTSAGGGYSRWRDLSVTRWREDMTRDCFGSFCYIRDLDSNALWSAAWQPTLRPGKSYEAIFTQARAEFRRRDEGIESHMEISVSPEDDVELRRISITNRSETTRTIEITSYAEVVLAPSGQDLAHPAFSNMFVQTEILPQRQAILVTRRPRSAQERWPYMVHLMTVQGNAVGPATYETDRNLFIGRSRTLASPAAMLKSAGLTNSQGSVLDPVVCIRQVIRLEPDETARIGLITGVSETRDAATAMIEKYHDPRLAERVLELAWTHSHIVLRQLNATEADAQVYGKLAGSVIYSSALRRAPASVIVRNRRGQSGLWGYGISGDLPIVLVRIRDRAKIDLVAHVLQAHAYWRLKGLLVDLVIWNEDDSVYRQALQDATMGLVAASPDAPLVDKPGGVFVRRADQMPEEDRVLLQAVARVVLVDDAGTLVEQAERRARPEPLIPSFRAPRRRGEPPPPPRISRKDLVFFNGTGGFTRDGREYITMLPPGAATPAPWVNVIANDQFGTLVSESGGGYTWSENCHEFRLTPWTNDAVSDVGGEAFYIRDEERGNFWSPTPAPARAHGTYVVRHGFGYTIFETSEDGIASEMCVYVATDAPAKVIRVRLRNTSGRTRQLSVTGYWEWVLGETRDRTHMHVATEIDPITNAIFARNPFTSDFPDRIAFLDCSESVRTVTGDRTEFFGRNGTAANPAGMRRVRLSGRTGAALDPCAAMQVPVELGDGQETDVVFVLGTARSEAEARQVLQRFRSADGAKLGLDMVWDHWKRTLGAVHVETPDPAVDFLVNGWLVYQVLSCRMWGRTGFYQSGGAFGFRDQLQDAMALVHATPQLLRAQILRAAGRQFRDGDVQHWWHPPTGRGVRTHCSDDYLWLPFATARYVAATGDTGILEERIHFLDARPLRPDEESYFDLPQVSEDADTLFGHCVRAIEHGLRFGAHGLPLMGSGDWNDGMNLVGEGGKGESVWLAFFLYDVLRGFSTIARARGDEVLATKYTDQATRLRNDIEQNAWDGQWYRRAYFDNGEPLGSSSNPECQIDSLPQSWSVFCGGGPKERATQAMENVDKHLVHRDTRLIQLFEPSFDKSNLNPGYIKGYVPGVRENGGQYTHAAVWTVMAFAAMGDTKRAWELFNLINPITHGGNAESAALYRVEPYVMCADVYALPPHTGRGGWTWYTGSAGWMYRLAVESLLGVQLEIDKLRLTPRLPSNWPSLKIHYRYRETFYHITVTNRGAAEVTRISVDGAEQPDKTIPMIDDHNEHHAEVELG